MKNYKKWVIPVLINVMPFVLTLVFYILKWTNVIDWKWYYLWLPVMLIYVPLLIFALYTIVKNYRRLMKEAETIEEEEIDEEENEKEKETE